MSSVTTREADKLPMHLVADFPADQDLHSVTRREERFIEPDVFMTIGDKESPSLVK